MIVCVCNRINSKAVREAVEAGATSPEAVQAHHGCQFNCGTCETALACLIDEAHTSGAFNANCVAAE